MKIAYYCQHVLGIGHFHRSLEICRELARHHEVQLIVGGPKVDGLLPQSLGLHQLPGLQMDAQFQHLAPCEPGLSLAEVKQQRQRQLYSYFGRFRPEVFVVELYPFGRKAFRFELDPVLQAIRTGQLSPCRCFVSLRDILVERTDDRERFEERAVATLNRYFDGLLIHADDKVIRLDETFSRCPDINVPVAYTGFVTPPSAPDSREQVRRRLQLDKDDRLIVVSIGGGNVGQELLAAAVMAYRLLADTGRYRLQLFSGPYCDRAIVEKLGRDLPAGVMLDHFTDRFPDWLQAADLSISMAGYNTCMNIIQAGVPALVYPFLQNREQSFRARRLAAQATIRILAEGELQPSTLAAHITEMSECPRYPVTVNLDGAAGSRRQIENWCQKE